MMINLFRSLIRFQIVPSKNKPKEETKKGQNSISKQGCRGVFRDPS